jgi:hypothetical protein
VVGGNVRNCQELYNTHGHKSGKKWRIEVVGALALTALSILDLILPAHLSTTVIPKKL